MKLDQHVQDTNSGFEEANKNMNQIKIDCNIYCDRELEVVQDKLMRDMDLKIKDLKHEIDQLRAEIDLLKKSNQ